MKIRLWTCLAVAAVVCAIIAIQPKKASAGPQKSDGSTLGIKPARSTWKVRLYASGAWNVGFNSAWPEP